MEDFHKGSNITIGAVHLKVTDLERAIAFYKQVIGLKVLEKRGITAQLTADGKTPLVILEQPLGVVRKSGRTAGLYHFALLLPSRRDLAAFLRHLLNTGAPYGAADHLVSEALYLNDLDGNGIEIYADRPSRFWRWKNGMVHMDTLELDREGILKESNDRWKGLPAGTIMGHIHLHVSHLDEAKTFYTKGLGYDVVGTYPQAYFLSTGGYHHHIAINTWQGVGVPASLEKSTGLKSFQIVFPDQKTRDARIEQLRQIGATVTGEGTNFFTRDPAGNRIELVVK